MCKICMMIFDDLTILTILYFSYDQEQATNGRYV